MLGKAFTAMVTPFDENLKVNYEQTEKLANYLVENGSDGVVVSGTTGESPTLKDKEKIELFKVVKKAIGGKGKVIAGTGNYCTEESIELTKKAEETGVDACMLVTPYYNKPPQDGLYLHFKTVAENTSLPVILYNVPSRTARNLEADTVIRLSEVKNIVGVKEASCDLEQVAKIISKSDNNFLVLSGEDSVTFPMLSLGADGVISVASHVAGNEVRKMVESYHAGDVKEAQKIHLRLLPLFKGLFINTNPIMIKAALNLKGMDVGGLRLPLVEATEAEVEKLETIMAGLNLL